MKHIFVAISLAFLGSLSVFASGMREKKTKPLQVFSIEDDNLLRAQVQQYGTGDSWSVIAKAIPGKNARQCRDRWNNYLNPSISFNVWTSEDDQLLIKKVQELGQHWVQIATFFEGKTGTFIKNRFLLLNRHGFSAVPAIPAAPTDTKEPERIILGDSEFWTKLGVNL